MASIETFLYCSRRIAIVGRGAVGTAIYRSLEPYISENDLKVDCYHSENIDEVFGKHYDLAIYAGVRAFKGAAEANPTADLMHILKAADTFKRISASRKILISTIDAGLPDEEITAYGRNRRLLEELVSDSFAKTRILRLPALFGSTVTKNTWYDMMIGPENVKLNKSLEDEINLENRPGERNINILSKTGDASKFVWFNLDTILEALARIIDLEKIHLAVSYDDAYKDGMLIRHHSLKEILDYGDVHQSHSYKSINYSTALTSQCVMFIKTPIAIDEVDHWKRVIKK